MLINLSQGKSKRAAFNVFVKISPSWFRIHKPSEN